MTREEAIEILKKNWPSEGYTMLREALEVLVPELRESEDERIRKEMISFLKSEKAFQFIDIDKSEKWIAYLEKQKEPLAPEEKMNHPLYLEGFDVGKKVGEVLKEQKPAEWPSNISNYPHNCKKCFAKCLYRKEDNPELNKPAEIHDPTDEELESRRKQLHDFKAFAAKQATEYHISFVHDFEWDAFCGELLSYFNEQHHPAEWSEEDEKMLRTIISDGIRGAGLDSKQFDWLKSLRPS